ncbi:MAG: TadE/TadG family type IV pilus assembly protein [Methylococcales bacterium]|nr:TadE/TadG family type IV pilus assembly protein [Methylococcales bacterium]
MSKFKQKGSSTVEFAMLVPLLLLLVVMVSEFGIMFYRLNAVTKSVQDVARYLSDVSVDKKIDSVLTNDQVKNLVCFGTIGGTGTEIVPQCNDKLTLEPPPAASDDHITVSATYDSDWVLPGLIGFLVGSGSPGNDPLALKASSVMRFAQ